MNADIVKFIFSRLDEASTKRGIVMFLTSLAGFGYSQTTWEMIINVGLTLVGVIGMILPDRKS